VSGHIDDRLGELVFGDLADAERAPLEAHAASCPPCQHKLDEALDTFAALALALPPEPPSPDLRRRVLDGLRAPRHLGMLAKLAELFDITLARARQLLEKLDDDRAWSQGPTPGSFVMFTPGAGGPRVDGATIGFVKVEPNVEWPAHEHLGTEYMLVLSGGFRQDDGVEVHAGQVHVMQKGSVHGFTIFPDEPCIAAAVVFGGIEFKVPGVAFDLQKR
jgi:putative transcriptional regulator